MPKTKPFANSKRIKTKGHKKIVSSTALLKKAELLRAHMKFNITQVLQGIISEIISEM